MSGNEEKYNQLSSKEGHGTDEGATSATTKHVNTRDRKQRTKGREDTDGGPVAAPPVCCLL